MGDREAGRRVTGRQKGMEKGRGEGRLETLDERQRGREAERLGDREAWRRGDG